MVRLEDQMLVSSQQKVGNGLTSHNKQPSLVSQISEFNQSVRCNQNYESIMKNTRQKIIQSHIMQSAQKQKPYLMRLSTIFGDKLKDISPVGHSSNVNLDKPFRKQRATNLKPPRYGELSPFIEGQNIDYCCSPELALDS